MDRSSESNFQIYVKGCQQDKRVTCFRSRTGCRGGRCGEVDLVLCKAGLFCGGLLCLPPGPWKSSGQDCLRGWGSLALMGSVLLDAELSNQGPLEDS